MQLRAEVVEDVCTLLLAFHQRAQRLRCGPPAVHRNDLLLDFAHNQCSAPTHVRLRDVDIRKDVVAHIHDVVAVAIKELLHHARVPARVDAALLHSELFAHHAVFCHNFVEGHCLGEEGRLSTRNDDDIKQVTPSHPLGQEAVRRPRHHHLGILPIRIGDERQLFARLTLIQQRQRQLSIQLHVPCGVRHNVSFESPLDMCLEQRLRHGVEELFV